MATITWVIKQLDRLPSNGFVTTAHWRVTAIDGEHSADAYGSTGWQTETPVIPYDQLTQDIVLDWVWQHIDKADIEANLNAQIEAVKNPTIANGVLW
jgi:hypothetical protein